MDLTDTRFLTREELNQHLAARQAQLTAIAAELKTELFGIDEVIDRVIDAVRAWYVMPQLIARPVIVCLSRLVPRKGQVHIRLVLHPVL